MRTGILLTRNPAVLLSLVIVLAAGMAWHYVDFFLPAVTARQHIPFEAHPRPYLGIDLYPYWLGTRELFGSHLSPYSDDIARRTQIELYGRPINPALPGEPKDQHRFSYPIFIVFLIAPLQHLPFATVRLVALVFLIVLVIATFLLWIEALTPGLPARWKIAGAFLILTSYPALEAVFAEQISIVVAALLAGTIFCLGRGFLKTAGVMFALATVKPQLVLLLAFALLCWTIGDWQRRMQFVRAACVTLGLLFVAAEIILPGWLFQWWSTINDYRGYTLPPLAQYLFGPIAGRVLSLFLVISVIFLCVKFRRYDVNSIEFAEVLSFVLCVTVIVFPSADAIYDHVLLIPVALVLFQRSDVWLANRPIIRTFNFVGLSAVAWPWITATVIVIWNAVGKADLHTQFYSLLPIRTAASIPFVLAALLFLNAKTRLA